MKKNILIPMKRGVLVLCLALVHPKLLSSVTAKKITGDVLYFSVDSTTLSTGKNAEMSKRYQAAEEWRKNFSSTIVLS